MLYIVIGPPAAGKSTWVLERANPGDIVIDYDRLAVALTGTGGDPHDHPPAVTAVTKAARAAAVTAALQRVATTDVYVIHSSPIPERMAEYRNRGAEIVTIDPGRDVVRLRCKTERPRRMFAAIDAWYAKRGGDTSDAPVVVQQAGTPAYSFPAAASRDW